MSDGVSLYKDDRWEVRRERASLPNGKIKETSRVYGADTVHILALNENGNILLLKEFRPFWGQWIYLLPSGKIDKETDMMEAAHRELREETGFDAKEMTHLWSVNSIETVNITHHIFKATGLFKSPLPQDESELIEVLEVSVEKALELVLGSPKVLMTSSIALLRWLKEGQ